MLNIFKTKYNFDIVWTNLPNFQNSKLGKLLNSKTNNYFFHTFEHSKIPKSFVCPFGKTMSKIVVGFLLLRNFSKLIKENNKNIIIFFSILTLLNSNVLIYMLPVMLLEYYMYKTNI
jgi:hypothetical protein